MVMRTLLDTPVSDFPAKSVSVNKVTWPRELTRSKVESSCTDNWFPAANTMLERSNAYRTYFFI
jgi:hypothetical protein